MNIQIPFYNVLNVFFVGIVSVICLSFVFPNEIKNMFQIIHCLNNEDLINDIVIYYGFGLIIGRIGSVVFEPLLKKLKLIKWTPDEDYCNASKSDSFLTEVLSRDFALYRSMFTLFFVMAILSAILKDWKLSLLFVAPIILFYFSVRKCSGKITKRVESQKNSNINSPG